MKRLKKGEKLSEKGVENFKRFRLDTVRLAFKIAGKSPKNVNKNKLQNVVDDVVKMISAKKIQKVFRGSRLTNEKLLKINNKPPELLTNKNIENLRNFDRKKIYERRHRNVVPQVKTIQRVFRVYKKMNIEFRKKFLQDLSKDGRFDYYVTVLSRLEYMTDRVLSYMRNLDHKDPIRFITSAIGVCHYKQNPRRLVTNVINVRKSLSDLKKKTPREYLQSMRRQFAFVTKEYSKFDETAKNSYRDRLYEELGERPCLENMIESLVKALSEPYFVWLGKSSDPVVENKKYIEVMNKAVTSWALAKNRPVNWNNKNLNSRKQVFWKMVKNLPLYVVYDKNFGPVNSTPNEYDKNGSKFKSSNISNSLEYA